MPPITQPIISGSISAINGDTASRVNALIAPGEGWSTSPDTSDVFYRFLLPIAGTFQNLNWRISTAPGAGDTRTLGLRKNSVLTVLTSLISGTDVVGSNDSDVVSVDAGDYVTLQSLATGTPASTAAFWGIVFIGSNPVLMGAKGDLTNTVTTEYSEIIGSRGTWTTSETNKSMLCAGTGTLRNFYVLINRTPGVGAINTFALRKNTSTTLLIVSITGSDSSGSDVINTVDINPGDLLSLENSHTLSPTATEASWSFEFVSSIDGECPVLAAATEDDFSATATEYNYISGHGTNTGWNPTESNRYGIVPTNFTARKLYMRLAADPDNGAGTQSVNMLLRQNTADTVVSAAISSGTISAFDIVNTANYLSGDYINWKCVPGSTPTVSNSYYSFVTFIDPGTSAAVVSSRISTLSLMGCG